MNYEKGLLRSDGLEHTVYEEQPRSRRRLIILAALGVLLIGIVGWALYGPGDKEAGAGAPAAGAQGQRDVPTVTVVVPGRQLVERVISATGSLAARREMPVGVVGEGGMVTRVLVEPGQWVGAGQVLAVVDRSVQTQQSAQLRAQIAAAEADRALAQAELERSQSLVGRGFVSQADLERKRATRDAAAARVRVATAQLAENNARIGRLDIRAPSAGLVLTRAVEPGQVVGSGSGVLFRLAQGGQMEMNARLSESDLAAIRVGSRANVIPVGTAQSFQGEVWQVSPVIDPQNRQGVARIALAYDPALRPGGFAAARIVAGTAEAPLLPESAVLSDQQGNYVYIVDKAGKVTRRPVETGTVTPRGIAITRGLVGNEQVVLRAGGFLNPGETVKPQRQRA